MENDKELDARIRALLRELTDSMSTRKAIAQAIPYNEPRYGRWLNNKWEGSLSALAYFKALSLLRPDLLTLLESEAARCGDLPKPVQRWIQDPRTKTAATMDELAAILSLARAGFWRDTDSEADVTEMWMLIREQRNRKKP